MVVPIRCGRVYSVEDRKIVLWAQGLSAAHGRDQNINIDETHIYLVLSWSNPRLVFVLCDHLERQVAAVKCHA